MYLGQNGPPPDNTGVFLRVKNLSMDMPLRIIHLSIAARRITDTTTLRE
jgi:hypothetical protein